MSWTKPKDKCVVVNLKRDRITGAVYIGRDERDPKGRGKWGNPFPIVRGERTRRQSIEEFKEYFYHPDQVALRQMARRELKGKVLACYCKPEDCHGDIIAAYVNGEEG